MRSLSSVTKQDSQVSELCSDTMSLTTGTRTLREIIQRVGEHSEMGATGGSLPRPYNHPKNHRGGIIRTDGNCTRKLDCYFGERWLSRRYTPKAVLGFFVRIGKVTCWMDRCSFLQSQCIYLC